jgi:hypothetical protein
MKERIVAVVAEPVVVFVSVIILALVAGIVVGTSHESQTADDHGGNLARGPSLLFPVQISTFFLISFDRVVELAGPIG